MASEEDDALLFLIYQHLKVRGHQRAAQVLEEHVTQVEKPDQRSNLQNIYTDWMRLCSLAPPAHQDPADSVSSGIKSITPEPGTSEEEAAESNPSNTTEEEVDREPPPEPRGEGVASSPTELVCVEDEADGEIKTENPDSERVDPEEKEEEPKTELERPPAEEPTTAEPSGLDSCDSGDVVEPPQNDPARGGSGPTEDEEPSPEASSSDGGRTDQLKRDQEETLDRSDVTDETSGLDRAAATHTDEVEVVEDSVKEQSPAEPSTLEPTPQETNDQPTECDAPPTADPDLKSHNDEEQGEGEEDSKSGDVTASLTPEEPTEALTDDLHAAADNENVTVSAAEEQDNPEDSIILNIRVEYGETVVEEPNQLLPEEVAESCEDGKSPKKKKKKKSKKETETPDEDKVSDAPLTTKKKKRDKNMQVEEAEDPKNEETDGIETPAENPSTINTPSDTPPTARSAKKKRRNKTRQEEVEKGDIPQTPSEKKAKKRKMEEEEVKKDEDPPTVKKKKKKKKVKDVEEESEAVKEESEAVKEENPETSSEKRKKKKRKNKRKASETQSDDQPAEGNADIAKTLEVTDPAEPPSSKKKHRLRKKLSLKKRMRRHLQGEGKKKNRTLSAGKKETTGGKKQIKIQESEGTLHTKPSKRPKPDPTEEDDTPKKKKKKKMHSEPEENSSKENNPPNVKKKKKQQQQVREEDESGVVSDLSAEFPEVFSSPLPNKREKKKNAHQDEKTENLMPVNTSQDLPSKKKKKKKPKEVVEEDEPAADTSTPVSTKKKFPKRKLISD